MDVIRFGRGIRALRVRARLTQAELSRRANLSRGVVARIEQGHADRVTVTTLEKVAAVLGARVWCRLSWQGEALDRLLDADHAAIVEQVLRRLRADDWTVAAEVSFNIFGERGSIDVLAFHPGSRVVLVVEVKSVVPDVQATLVTLDRKERLALEIAHGRGWNGVAVARLLVIRDARTARRRVAAHSTTFAMSFPDRIDRIRRWLLAPDARHPIRGLWFLSIESQAIATQQVRRPRRRPERGSEDRS